MKNLRSSPIIGTGYTTKDPGAFSCIVQLKLHSLDGHLCILAFKIVPETLSNSIWKNQPLLLCWNNATWPRTACHLVWSNLIEQQLYFGIFTVWSQYAIVDPYCLESHNRGGGAKAVAHFAWLISQPLSWQLIGVKDADISCHLFTVRYQFKGKKTPKMILKRQLLNLSFVWFMWGYVGPTLTCLPDKVL